MAPAGAADTPGGSYIYYHVQQHNNISEHFFFFVVVVFRVFHLLRPVLAAHFSQKVLSLVTIKQIKSVMKLVLFNKSANVSVRDTSSGQKNLRKKKRIVRKCDACHVGGVWEVFRKLRLNKLSEPSRRGRSLPRCAASQHRLH